MTNKKSSPNSSLTILGFLLMIAGLVGNYQFLLPQLKQANLENQTAVAQDKALKTEIASLQETQTKLAEIGNNLQAQGTDIKIVDTVYPPTEDIPSLYIQLENLKNQASNISSFTYQVGVPTPAKTGSSGVIIPITLNATGNYADLKTMIANFETNIRPIQFSTLSFAQSDKGGYTLVASGFTRAANLSSAYASSSVK